MADSADASAKAKGEDADGNGTAGTTNENKVDNEKEETEKQSSREVNDVEREVTNEGDETEAKIEGESEEKYDYTASLMTSSIYHDNDINVDPEIIEQLTKGFVEQFLPSLRKTQATIAQIKDSQQVLIDTVEQENSKFNECQAISRLDSTMAKAKVYHSKLLKLRKEMTALHEKSAKLKRRAVKMQQQKQKDEMTRAQMLEKEYEREKMLTARVATGTSDS